MYLIQHGWGKGNRIAGAIADSECDGVIAGPCDESPSNLEGLLGSVADAQLTALFDPQFYVFTLPQPNLKRLHEYPYARPGLRPQDFSARGTTEIVRACLEYQANLQVSALISPSVHHGSLNDRWAQIALTLASESIAQHRDLTDERPLYCSVVVSEECFADREALDEFLDSLTELECQGFYLVVVRSSSTYDLVMDTTKLTNLLAAIYSLSELNDFHVVVGYADLLGFVYRAAGAHAFGSGWYQTLRRFHLDRWLGGDGGRAPRPRYTSASLINSILLETELRAIADQGRLNDVLGSTSRDAVLTSAAPRVDQATWSLEDGHRQYMSVCKVLDDQIAGSLLNRLRAAYDLASGANQLYRELTSAGVVFGNETGPRHLSVWMAALDGFAAELGVSL